MSDIIITTTDVVQDHEVDQYLEIVSGNAMMGANVVKDVFAGIRDIVGGRSGAYEKEITKGREEAVKDLKNSAKNLGADAVIGVSFDFEEMREGMLWINATGTAVKLK